MRALQSPLERQKDLYQLAEWQSGYFTTKQASALGYTSNKRICHVCAGNWIREHRGTYRIARFPEPDRPDLSLTSYDRLFPNQNTTPTGGFGNLVALPLQKIPRRAKNSILLTTISIRSPISGVIWLAFQEWNL